MREGWEVKNLGDVCYFENGDRGKNYPSKKHYVSEGFPFITAANVENGQVLNNLNYITEDRFKLLSRGKFKKNDFLFCLRGSLGKFGFIQNDLIGGIASSMVIVRTGSSVEDKWLHYYFISDICHKEIENRKGGAAQPNLGAKDLKRFEIPIPPLEEQKQIVAILDQAFAAIDQAKANISTNIENAKELFQSKLNQIFSQTGDGWEEKTLGEMSKIMYGYTSKVTENGNVQYVRITDIQDGNVDWSNVPYINISEKEKSKYKLSKGDIVFARTGATTGKSYLIENSPDAVFASYLIRVQCDSNVLLPSFLYLFFQSGIYWQIVEKGTSGSAQGGFNASKLGAMKIHFPSNKTQQLKYVELVESIRIPTNNMIRNYEKKLNDLKELKKSILQKAFAGELTKEGIAI
ncbi:MAG: restriction endonuclease subunit S [Tenacibaculum sp.]|uniref:restriction endonuclease subunit S n=1 Tax=Tenacibaculum sp. TaxID=1906242 RepID=UPI0017DAC741|nr:restriction endonuclease subunit S [Tenacibaculum sp.]NVK10135.1 restriction endonuclease subunit S [Tenacibaculum sp.]